MPAGPSSDDREQKIKQACNCLLHQRQYGRKPNIKQAARDFGIPYSTLHARFSNIHSSPSEARQSQSFLSPSVEFVLVKWAEYLGEIGVPLSKKAVRARAQQLHPLKKRPSRNWVYAFLKRHPSLSFFNASALDPKRAKAFNEPVIGRYFDKLAELVEKHEIPIENIYNMDEKGVQRGGGKKASRRKYLYSRKQRAKYKHRSANLELITIIEAVCADGTKLKPGFVFSGATQSPEWYEEDPEIVIATSTNGWTDDFIGGQWFRLSFIPQATARNTSGKPILLVLDGHGSHETIQLIDLAEKHNIIILLLPPHTTHKLQPLDVGVFGPFSRRWIDHCDDVVLLTGSEMRKENFVKEYMAIREETFRPAIIISAFKKSGLWPVNRHIFTAEDYAPSVPYSTEARHAPEFPAAPPLAPILPPRLADHTNEDSGSESDSDSDSDSDLDSDSEDDAPTQQLPFAPPPNVIPATPAQPLASSSSSPSSASPAPSTPTPIPHRHFYYDPVLFARIQVLESEVQALKAQVGLAGTELAFTKRKLNERDARVSKKRKLNVEARVLTSAEGKKLAAEKEAERTRKDQKKVDAAQRRREKENQRDENRRNRDPNAAYTGLLSAKNKDNLVDIAFSLQLDEAGTRAALLERITKYFDEHPTERDSNKYRGLFTRAPRGRRAAIPSPPIASTSQAAPPPSTSQLPAQPTPFYLDNTPISYQQTSAPRIQYSGQLGSVDPVLAHPPLSMPSFAQEPLHPIQNFTYSDFNPDFGFPSYNQLPPP